MEAIGTDHLRVHPTLGAVVGGDMGRLVFSGEVVAAGQLPDPS